MDELVADQVRLGGRAPAKEFFEQGFVEVFERIRTRHDKSVPMTVYYAFRQVDAVAEGTASTGWETMLGALIQTGWLITGTWPIRTEQAGGLRALGRNALASSVVVVCRPREASAEATDVRGFVDALRTELPEALRRLQQGAIAPVDLPQAAVGPGIRVFSRYRKVLEDDGSGMSVRSALARINEVLDQVLNEQEGDFDADTRFALAWYRQYGYATGQFGEADNMARARNTAVDRLARGGILTSAAGKVALIAAADLPARYDVLSDERTSAWEVLHHLIAILDRDGLPAAAAFLLDVQARPDAAVDVELVRELAFLLFSIAEKNGWTQPALAFNTVVTAWPDVLQAGRSARSDNGDPAAFEFEED